MAEYPIFPELSDRHAVVVGGGAVLDKGGRLVVNAIRKETAVPELDYTEHLWLEKEIKTRR